MQKQHLKNIHIPLPKLLGEAVITYTKAALISSCIVLFISNETWQYFLSIWPYSERTLYVVGSFLIHELLYFGMNGFFALCDRYSYFQGYRLPRKPSQLPSNDLIKSTLYDMLVSHFVFQLLSSYLVFPVHLYFGMIVGSPIPSYWTLAWQLILFSIGNDIIFYWIHRGLHTPWFYKTVHKQHHEYIGTIGIGAEHAHWFEGLVANLLPPVIIPILFGAHLITWWVWIFITFWDAYEMHSGYAFKWSPVLSYRGYHDYHHTHNSGNFSNSPFLDYLFGTNDSWLQQNSTTHNSS